MSRVDDLIKEEDARFLAAVKKAYKEASIRASKKGSHRVKHLRNLNRKN